MGVAKDGPDSQSVLIPDEDDETITDIGISDGNIIAIEANLAANAETQSMHGDTIPPSASISMYLRISILYYAPAYYTALSGVVVVGSSQSFSNVI